MTGRRAPGRIRRRSVHPKILAMCKMVTAKRPATVINHIIKHGYITTEDLQETYGYAHAPRAARDVRELGIPLDTFKVESSSGRKIGAYKFGNPEDIKQGRLGGRRAFSKSFRNKLLEKYESKDAFTGERLEARMLQIDHRVPYEIAGEVDHESSLDEYMLLDGSSQRAKSWSCEHCSNWKEGKDENTCRSCFWASPEEYTHIAGEHIRRVDIQWRGAQEVDAFERMRKKAEKDDMTVASFLKRLSIES